MSLQFNAIGDYAEIYNDAAALGSSVNTTVLVWYRKEDSTLDHTIMEIRHLGVIDGWRISSTAGNVQAYSSIGGGTTTDYALASNTYAALALVRNGRYTSWYAWTEAGVRTDVSLSVDQTDYGTNTSIVSFGNGQRGYGDTASGQYRYGRVWARALTATELDAEVAMTPSSGTPAASTTNLRGSWALADGTTTTDWSAAGNALTINSGSTGTDEPTIPGGGGSTTRGMPFGNRSTAFNGGRILTGPLY
jgi:hypothetical protein